MLAAALRLVISVRIYRIPGGRTTRGGCSYPPHEVGEGTLRSMVERASRSRCFAGQESNRVLAARFFASEFCSIVARISEAQSGTASKRQIPSRMSLRSSGLRRMKRPLRGPLPKPNLNGGLPAQRMIPKSGLPVFGRRSCANKRRAERRQTQGLRELKN
jgi:hypothetical protein